MPSVCLSKRLEARRSLNKGSVVPQNSIISYFYTYRMSVEKNSPIVIIISGCTVGWYLSFGEAPLFNSTWKHDSIKYKVGHVNSIQNKLKCILCCLKYKNKRILKKIWVLDQAQHLKFTLNLTNLKCLFSSKLSQIYKIYCSSRKRRTKTIWLNELLVKLAQSANFTSTRCLFEVLVWC